MKKVKKIKIKANGKTKSNILELPNIDLTLPFTLIFIFFTFFIVYKC